jgi:hypothetical protein
VKIRDGIRRLERLLEELVDGSAIAEPYAAALGAQAKREAARGPTPQARMAASALVVRGAELLVPASATVHSRTRGSLSAGRVAGGSEYGSGIYRQFGPRRSSGAWLGAAANRPDASTLEAGESALEQLVERSVR